MIKSLISDILRKLNYRIAKIPRVPLSQQSVIVPAESWRSSADDRLIDLSLCAIAFARSVDHSDIAERMKEYPHWPNIWPGEHYKLLSGLIQCMQPKLAVEIGTATGYSALAIKKFLPSEAKLISFDIIPWHEFPNCVLDAKDFEDGTLQQVIADLSEKTVFEIYAGMLRKADFVFIDAAKDGHQEQRFIDHFKTVSFETQPIFMFDDIRLMNMIEIWDRIDKPKLDLTSFGHWAGTGLVNW